MTARLTTELAKQLLVFVWERACPRLLPSRRHLLSISLFALLVVLAPAAPAAGATIMDSGAVLGHVPSILWMDEHRVLFLGASGEYCKRDNTPNGYRKPLNRIAVFDTRTRQLTWHGKIGSAVCYSNENIRYTRQIVKDGMCPTDEWEWLRGRFGEETVQPNVPIDVDTCLPESEAVAAARKEWVEKTIQREKEENQRNVRLVRLRSEHGWLAILEGRTGPEPSYERRPLAIYPPGREEQPILIDRAPFAARLEKKGYGIEFMRYEAFKGAYLLALNDGSGFGEKYGALWWLHPDGRVEPLLTHRREGGWEHFIYLGMTPTRTGILAIGGKASPNDDQSGLYRRAPNGKPEIIDRGLPDRGGITRHHTVSPDGCKLAYGIDPRGFGRWAEVYRLRVVDVCAEDQP